MVRFIRGLSLRFSGLFATALFVASIAAAQQPSPPAKTWTNNLGMDFALIPAGSFQMGSKNGVPDEGPLPHE